MNKSYRKGYVFQQRVKKCLEKLGWFCVVQPRSKFPDIIAVMKLNHQYFDVIMVECKMNKYLSKEEKEKSKTFKDKCSLFLVAYKKGRELLFRVMVGDTFYDFNLDKFTEIFKRRDINGNSTNGINFGN